MLSLCGTILGLAITIAAFIFKWIRNTKAKKNLEQMVKVGNAVLPFIREAEKFAAYSGAEKKAYVMTKANQFAIENRIAFNEQQISDKIEEIVNLTKQINVKPTVEARTAEHRNWL